MTDPTPDHASAGDHVTVGDHATVRNAATAGDHASARNAATDTDPSIAADRPTIGAGHRRRARGWVPDQHGAWAMLSLPPAVGIWLAGPVPAHLALVAFWFVGYLAYHAATRWLRTRHRSREFTPLVVYGSLALTLGAVTALAAPHLLRWSLVYAPLLAVSLTLTARGRERSLTNDLVTVVAAGLMTPVAFATAVGATGVGATGVGARAGWSGVVVATAVLTAYLAGTVFYVKTMIRERGRTGYLVASVGYHLAGVLAIAVLVATDWQSVWSAAVWCLLALRAYALPAINAHRDRPLRPAVVGVGEIVASLAVTSSLLAGLPPVAVGG